MGQVLTVIVANSFPVWLCLSISLAQNFGIPGDNITLLFPFNYLIFNNQTQQQKVQAHKKH